MRFGHAVQRPHFSILVCNEHSLALVPPPPKFCASENPPVDCQRPISVRPSVSVHYGGVRRWRFCWRGSDFSLLGGLARFLDVLGILDLGGSSLTSGQNSQDNEERHQLSAATFSVSHDSHQIPH